MPNKRPEHTGPAEMFYDEKEARKYTRNTRILEVQTQCTERALELLMLPEGKKSFLLDLGCGSGLSGEILDQNGHLWTGLDISPSMLEIAKEREVEGDLMKADLGDGLPFQPGSFDGAISISAIQWLCNADGKGCNPVQRLGRFFRSLYGCLARGSRAVFQFYPEDGRQADLIVKQAFMAGFSGGLLVDFPNSAKAKKIYLVLMTGGQQPLPEALESQIPKSQQISQRRDRVRRASQKKKDRGKSWIMKKKEQFRNRGNTNVPLDSKYTGRKRRGGF